MHRLASNVTIRLTMLGWGIPANLVEPFIITFVNLFKVVPLSMCSNPKGNPKARLVMNKANKPPMIGSLWL